MLIQQILRVHRLHRGLATHSGYISAVPAVLHLKTGQSFFGRSFGAPISIFGETVFSTSITSCTLVVSMSSFLLLNVSDTESMTDPSYRGQILVFTTPLIGNYGVPLNRTPINSHDVGVLLESQEIQCSGVVVGDVAEKFSHYAAVESISSWCKRHNVPGITGVDTRAITTLLRDQGTTLGRLAIGADASAPSPNEHEYWDPTIENLVDQVSTKVPYELNPSGDIKIAVVDFGVKANILRSLIRRGAAVTVLPWNYDFNAVRDRFDGLFLTNGPGDPAHCMEAALILRRTLNEWDKPIFGICMGHQVIGMAAGLDAYRMTFGNRGHNQPVLALASSGSIKEGRVYVTRCVLLTSVLSISILMACNSQNHQYALKLQDPFPAGWEPFFINCNDSSVEGIKSTFDSGKKVWGVQFHPESAGGPLDTMEVFAANSRRVTYLTVYAQMFTDFVAQCRAHKVSLATLNVKSEGAVAGETSVPAGNKNVQTHRVAA
jgi:carbamoyl-phosphate synthase small subunit